jgi:hypothetical protein
MDYLRAQVLHLRTNGLFRFPIVSGMTKTFDPILNFGIITYIHETYLG